MPHMQKETTNEMELPKHAYGGMPIDSFWTMMGGMLPLVAAQQAMQDAAGSQVSPLSRQTTLLELLGLTTPLHGKPGHTTPFS